MSRQAVTIVSGRWAPVTAGEYDRRARRVTVNEVVVEHVVRVEAIEATMVRAAIVAHELAHAGAHAEARVPGLAAGSPQPVAMGACGASRADEERAARAAAVAAAGEPVVRAIERALRAGTDADRPRR